MDEIRTERLLLRKARLEDLEAMHRILADPRAMRYWSSLPHETIDQSREWLEAMISSPVESSLDFIVELQGETIGKAGFYRLPEIGYLLHPDHWGLGIATEALRASIDAAFARFDLPAITADVDPRNRASIRLLEKLGFQFTHKAERTFRIGDQWCDSFYYELKRG
jgi:[ribosomal protein S5]-alanine N-acetyltransferase